MISIILGSGDLPANLASAVSTTSIFRLPLAPGSAIERVMLGEARHSDRVFVTYSASNPPPDWLKHVSDKVEWIDVSLKVDTPSIGASVLAALESFFFSSDTKNQEIRILYGDTLTDLLGLDIVAVGHSVEPEDWSYAPENLRKMPINSRASDTEPRIITGLFCFEDGGLFFNLLRESTLAMASKRGAEPFYNAILAYANTHPSSLEFELDSGWQDFGHLNTYMAARKGSLEGRTVNSFGASERGLFVTKSSSRIEKLQNEASWFRDVPDELYRFLPRVILPPSEENYHVQFIRAVTLSEKILYSQTHLIDWDFVFESLESWLSDASTFPAPRLVQSTIELEPDWFRNSFLNRSTEILGNSSLDPRISQALLDKQLVLDKALDEVSAQMQSEPLCVVHGDLILSNVLVTERDKLFKLIDPRGGFSHRSIYGPPIYEWAKIAQSVYGRYEEILAGEYRWDDEQTRTEVCFFEDFERDSNYEKIRVWFEKRCPYSAEARKLAGLLLVSAIPFHFEDPTRALAMFQRGLSLIEER